MKRPLILLFCATLSLGACSPTPVAQPTASAPTPPLALASPTDTLSSEIRPGSKGQRLEFSGEMEIPAGTSSYAIQSAAVDNGVRLALQNLLMPPAYAEDEIADGDEPISDSQITELTARVNGEKVDLTITRIVTQDDGALIVSYKLKNVPPSEDNAIIEFTSPSGAFKIKGVAAELSAGNSNLGRFDVETTALAEALLNQPVRPKHLSAAQLKSLLKSEAVQTLRDQVLELFVKPAAKPQPFETGLKAVVQQTLPGSSLARYLEQAAKCGDQGNKCPTPPVLPPAEAKPIPTTLATAIRRRQTLRQQLLQDTHPPTALERAELLQLGPLLRLKACVQRKISPCP